MVISSKTKEILNFMQSFEELQILGEMGTQTNPPLSRYVAARDCIITSSD